MPKFCQVYEEVLEKAILSPAFNRAYIRVLLKVDKNHTQCGNYCFILLINVNIKILTANIFHKVILVAIKYVQGGLIKARQPSDNIGLVMDPIELNLFNLKITMIYL